MKILITGAAGFIGFHVSRRFLELGHSVTGIDSMTNYYSTDLKKYRIEILAQSNLFNYQQIDISNRSLLENLFDLGGFDTVIHLAAQPGVRVVFSDSEQYSKANLLGFGNIIQCVTAFKVPVFLYASSSSVYGNASEIPFNEATRNLKPLNYYGGTKLSNEILAEISIIGTQTTAIGLRFFTVYGPWGRPDMAYFKILMRNLFNRDFTLFGNGEALRDFTYIDDVVTSIEKLENWGHDNAKGTNTIVNIGGGNPSTMSELINNINRETKYFEVTKQGFIDPADMQQTYADPRLLEKLIAYKPKTSLTDGVKFFVDWANDPEIYELLKKLK